MLAGPASALSITSDKHSLKSGEIVTINVAGLTNNTSFDLKVTDIQQMNSLTSAFGNFNVTVPFAIGNPALTVSEVNTTENSITIGEDEAGQYNQMVFNGSSVNGQFSRNQDVDNFNGGNLTSSWATTPVIGAQYVTSIFELIGTKVDGPDIFTMDASGYSTTPSIINIEIRTNGTLAYQDTINFDQGTQVVVIPTLIPGGSSASGSNDYTGANRTTTPVANNTTANMTANVTPVISVTSPVATTTGQSGEVVPSTGMKMTETTTDLSGAATTANTANTTNTRPAGAPFALVTLIGLGLACLVIRSRR
jgi:hypothetical protein